MNITFGYARVSTQDQSLELQIDALRKHGVSERYLFNEKLTGTKRDRPQLDAMLEQVREGDTVVVYKLDRISRSTKHLIELAELFKERGVTFVSICDNIDTSTPMGQFFFTVMAGLSQLERDLISERTTAGLQAARARGRVGGRPKKNSEKVDLALKMYDSKDYTVPQITEATGVSKTTLYRAINERKRSLPS